MTPAEQTHTEFEIKRMERARLDALLIQYGLYCDLPLIEAIQAYACANARAAVAICREVKAGKG